MSQHQSVPLSAIELQTLENNLRARRGASVLVVGARCPMEAFQEDMRESAQRLGFQPVGDGRFIITLSPRWRRRAGLGTGRGSGSNHSLIQGPETGLSSLYKTLLES